jgi:hypothetical protein
VKALGNHATACAIDTQNHGTVSKGHRTSLIGFLGQIWDNRKSE